MKHPLLLTIASIGFAFSASAAPTDAPFIDHRIEVLQKQINIGLQSGKLTQIEGNQLQRDLDQIKKTEERIRKTGTITPRTRTDLRNNLDKLEKNIDRKSEHPKPATSTSPSASASPGGR